MSCFTGGGTALAAEFEFEFEFGQGSHDRRDCPPGGRGGVDPFTQCPQHDAPLSEVSNSAGDFGDAAAETVDGGDHHSVTGTGVVHHRSHARPRCFGRSRELVGEHRLRSNASGGQDGWIGDRYRDRDFALAFLDM